ncbi:MAG: hypothetical protein ACTS2F_16410 [Thainema sp.]
MQTIHAKVQVGTDRTLQVQLPNDVPVGEYEVVLVLNEAHSAQQASDPADMSPTQLDDDIATRWEQWVAEVEQLPLSPQPPEGDFQQYLVEKYRQQGLDL